MVIDDLWVKLTPRMENLQTLKKDLEEGKVPELPYFIIDQDNVKNAVKERLEGIDGDRMRTSLIIAQYGNGKTNLLKYLQLFFDTNDKFNINVLYSRVDVDQPDIILFILKLIQDNYTSSLIEYIVELRNINGIEEKLANNYVGGFASIKEYTQKLFEKSNSVEDIKKIIYLGTGRLYNKGQFSAYNLEQLHNFNRREVLVLLLNILAEKKCYLLFALDEIEKILEKSKLRFNQFLTSYREFIDLFNKIRGHYLLTCLTDANESYNLELANPAFFERIKDDIKNLLELNNREDVLSLTEHLNELFDTKKTVDDLEKIVTQLLKLKISKNRELVRNTVRLLKDKQERVSFDELLVKYKLQNVFNDYKSQLELEGNLKSVNQKFFDPLVYYLEDNYLLSDENSQIDRRNYQSFHDEVNKKVHFFIFNDNSNIEVINKKVNYLVNNYDENIVIYSPILLELSNSSINITITHIKYEIVDYDPINFFILLNIYREDMELRSTLATVISSITNNNL